MKWSRHFWFVLQFSRSKQRNYTDFWQYHVEGDGFDFQSFQILFAMEIFESFDRKPFAGRHLTETNDQVPFGRMSLAKKWMIPVSDHATVFHINIAWNKSLLFKEGEIFDNIFAMLALTYSWMVKIEAYYQKKQIFLVSILAARISYSSSWFFW